MGQHSKIILTPNKDLNSLTPFVVYWD